jgi:LytS/YehU family sensor histidine kinase
MQLHVWHARELTERKAELTQSRISIMLSQIQPHFLYNSLNSIYYLCEEDPLKAQQAIGDFSDYLRGNLDSLKRTEPVPFEQELKHIQIYLSLEKMRFDKKLNVVYDIETMDFCVPALSIQPIVENAVRYGVGKKAEGGTVMLRVKEKPDSYCITVSDDGVGFDPYETQDDGRTHVGIDNVKRD